MTGNTATLKSYDVTITLADTQHPGLWWGPIDKVMVANGYAKSLDPSPATIGPMQVTYRGVSYAEEPAVLDDLEKKFKAAGIGQVSVKVSNTGGTLVPK